MFSSPLSGKAETVKCSYLFIWVGENGKDIFYAFTIADSEQDLSAYLAKFDTYVEPMATPFLPDTNFTKGTRML